MDQNPTKTARSNTKEFRTEHAAQYECRFPMRREGKPTKQRQTHTKGWHESKPLLTALQSTAPTAVPLPTLMTAHDTTGIMSLFSAMHYRRKKKKKEKKSLA